ARRRSDGLASRMGSGYPIRFRATMNRTPYPLHSPGAVRMTVSTLSTRPVTLPSAPERGADLHVRVTAPAEGDALGVVVFSHGFGWSLDGYGPLAEHWAEHGLVVVQPTHLDSTSLALAADDARTPNIWRHRIHDLVSVIDGLDLIEQ